jgi:hypothetical protein
MLADRGCAFGDCDRLAEAHQAFANLSGTSVASWTNAGMLSGNRISRSVLTGMGNQVTFSEVVSGHNYANFQQTFPDCLIALLGDKVRRR